MVQMTSCSPVNTSTVSVAKLVRKPAYTFCFAKEAEATSFLEAVDELPGVIAQKPIETTINGKVVRNSNNVIVKEQGLPSKNNSFLDMLKQKAEEFDGQYLSGVLGYDKR